MNRFPGLAARLVLVGCALVMWPAAARSQPLDKETKDALDQLLKETRESWEVPGVAVAIVRGDRVLYLKGSGVRKLGGQDPVTPDTLFQISSCSKAFTTTAMAMLMDDGKLAWDDPVRKFLPSFHLYDPFADAHATLRDLVSHRTGLGGHDLLAYRAPWGVEEQVRRIGLVKPARSFRGGFEYQGIMFTAAGLAVGRAAEMPWSDVIKKRILEPLEMTNTHTTTAPMLKASDYASPHRRNREGKVAVVPLYEFTEPNPAVSMSSSARDLTNWLRFQLGDGRWSGKRLVSEQNLHQPHMPQTIIPLVGTDRATNPLTTQMSYGMGWVVYDYRGHLVWAHAGIIDGMRAHIALVPDLRLGLAILTNLHMTRMNLALSNTIMDQVFGSPQPRVDWNAYYQAQLKGFEAGEKAEAEQRKKDRIPNTKPSHPLAAYVGAYEDPAYGTAQVTLENDHLVWKWSAFGGPLEHYHYDTFTLKDERLKEPLANFTFGADGAVTGLRIIDVDFTKVVPKK